LSDPGAEEALYDIQSMRAFAGLELGRDAIPDETTILNFRHLLEAHDLTKAIFEVVSAHLEDKGALLPGGTEPSWKLHRYWDECMPEMPIEGEMYERAATADNAVGTRGYARSGPRAT
jgi:IS5 family transposase